MTLVAALAAGVLLWFAPHFHRWTTGGYWGVIALMTVAGVLVGISQLHGRDANPSASFVLVFVPVLIAAGWVILATQPQPDWVRNHILSWSSDMGIGHAVHNLGEHVAVLAFGLGIVFGVMFEPRMVRRAGKKAEATIGVPGGELQQPNAAAGAELGTSTTPSVAADPEGEEPAAVEPPTTEPAHAAPTVEVPAPGVGSVAAAFPHESTVVEPPSEAKQPDASATTELAPSTAPPVPAGPDVEEPTVVEPPAQGRADAAPTVELPATGVGSLPAGRAEEDLTTSEPPTQQGPTDGPPDPSPPDESPPDTARAP